MKRKLPQWLLDAVSTNNNDDKSDSRKWKRKILNESHVNTNGSREFENSDSNLQISQSFDPLPNNNGAISVVPLANLLSTSRGGATIDNVHTSDDGTAITLQRTSGSESTGIGTVTMPVRVVIKQEIVDSIDVNSSDETINRQQFVVKQEIKEEPVGSASSNVGMATNTPPVPLVPKIEDVKPERRSCNYGIKCFRRNPDHRSELAHPGDMDYRRPNLPNAPNAPPCPWGAACYRRNPQHFLQLSHPPANIYNPTANAIMTTTTTGTVRPQQTIIPPRQRNRNNVANSRADVDNRSDSDTENDYDLEDPFIDDGSSDEYVPDGQDEDEDDDDEDTGEI